MIPPVYHSLRRESIKNASSASAIGVQSVRPTWFEDLAVPKGPTLQTDQGQPQPLHGLKLVIKEEALRKLALSPGVALRSTQVRLTCVAGVTRKGEETKGTPALAFSSSLFVSGPTLKTSPISQCHPQWLLWRQQSVCPSG